MTTNAFPSFKWDIHPCRFAAFPAARCIALEDPRSVPTLFTGDPMRAAFDAGAANRTRLRIQQRQTGIVKEVCGLRNQFRSFKTMLVGVLLSVDP